jgi:alpha,alpha-trehalose phosphorylase
VQSIIAAEVGYAELAERYFRSALYVDLADLHRNTDAGVHVASLGGLWQALVAGFGGMRDYLSVWSFDPRLPESWESLTFPLTLQGNRLRVVVEHETITFTLETGTAQALPVTVQGRRLLVTRDAPLVVPLESTPVLSGRPSVRDIVGAVREDGSVIQATVPAHPTFEDVDLTS